MNEFRKRLSSRRDLPIFSDPYYLWALLSVMIAVILFLGSLALNFHGDLTGQVRVGKMFYAREGVAELVERSKPTVQQEIGFDGQFYFYLAHDPFLMKKATLTSMDAPFLRARRIFYPLLIRAISPSGQHVDRGIVFSHILALLAIALTSARLLKMSGSAPSWVPVVTLTLPASLAFEYLTSETIALGLLFIAFWAYTVKRRKICFVACALAVLTKEPSAALILSFVIYHVMRKRWWQGIACAGAIIPFALWVAFLHFRTAGAEYMSGTFGNLGMPFEGLAPQWLTDVARVIRGKAVRVNLLRAGTMLWFVAGAALLVAAFVRMRSAATIFGLFASLLAVLVTGACYEFLFHFGRQLYIVPAAVFFVAMEQNGISKESRGSEEIEDPKQRSVLKLCNSYGAWLVVGFILTLCWHYLRLKGKTI